MERTEILAVLSRVNGVRWENISTINFSTFPLRDQAAWCEVGFKPSIAHNIANAFTNWKQAALCSASYRVVAMGDKDYPVSLCNLYSPPLVLYVWGSLCREEGVAVVGTRKASPYGRQAVETFVPILVSAGLSVVSGLARGIDTLAHVATLRYGGHTVGVLGCGLDRIYPRENNLLAQRIVEMGGAVVTEYPEGTPPYPAHFPARNRIISGLSRACLVIEGDVRSGSLITAGHALEQGKEVLAVPGSIFSPQSRGPNYLISQGATPLMGPESLREALGIIDQLVASNEAVDLSDDALNILNCLKNEPCTVDEVILLTGLPAAVATAALSELEVVGMVERMPGGQYVGLGMAHHD